MNKITNIGSQMVADFCEHLRKEARVRGYQGGHDFNTANQIAGARAMHNAKPPRTATAEEMRPHQQYGGHDWSNYRSDMGNDLSGTWGASSGPGYMERINDGRDAVLARGGDLSAMGVTPIAPAPSPTAQPAAAGATAFGGALGGQAQAYPTPGTPEYDAAMKLRTHGSDDFQAAKNGPGHLGYRPDGTWGLVMPAAAAQPTAPQPAAHPAAPQPAAQPAAPAPTSQPVASYDPATDPAVTTYTNPPAATYNPATDPAVTAYTNPASSPAAVPTPPVSSEPTSAPAGSTFTPQPFGVDPFKPSPGPMTSPSAPAGSTYTPKPFGVDPFKPAPTRFDGASQLQDSPTDIMKWLGPGGTGRPQGGNYMGDSGGQLPTFSPGNTLSGFGGGNFQFRPQTQDGLSDLVSRAVSASKPRGIAGIFGNAAQGKPTNPWQSLYGLNA